MGRRTVTAFPLRPLLAATLLGCAAALGGCASTARSTERLTIPAARIAAFQRLAIAPLDVDVLETDLLGHTRELPDKRAVVRGRLSTAIEARTGLRYVPSIDLRTDSARAELADVQALFRTLTAKRVADAQRETSPRAASPNFADFRLGRIDALADELGVDGVLLVYTYDRASTGARKAAAALPIALAATTGLNVGPRTGLNVCSAALVARDGRVLWFNVDLSTGDPRLADDSERLVRRLLGGWPLAR